MQVSTLVVTLNHGCCRCFTKIRKTLCKLQGNNHLPPDSVSIPVLVIGKMYVLAETEDIRAISYDEVSGMVMISGAFDPLVLPASSGARRAA